MYTAKQNLQKGNLKAINPNMLFGLMVWTSNYAPNINVCADINRNFFFVDNNLLLEFLSVKAKHIMTKYPKPVKFDTKKYDLIVSYLVEHYNYGKNDIVSARKIIEHKLKDKKALLEFADLVGMDNKERKVLGLEQQKFDKEKMKPKKGKSLFDI